MHQLPITSEFLYGDPENIDTYNQWMELEKVVSVKSRYADTNSKMSKLALAVICVRRKLFNKRVSF